MSQSSRSLTPELLDLMEHEKVIEQGLATFVDVGYALLQIREGKKYRAAGYSTFEDYCKQRWEIDRTYAHRLMTAAEVVEMLPTGNTIEPRSEAQVRPLAPLRDQPDEAAAAWAEAVEEADGEQPTAKQVERAVAKRVPAKKEHPAPFSDPILNTIGEKVRGASTVLDPFAGVGNVHKLRDLADVEKTIGIEIEPEWAAKHPDTIEGNALDMPFDDGSIPAIVTSPTYGNRMADHHDAKDDSTRHTYKHTLGRNLNESNSGQLQWGDEYRAFHLKAWTEAVRVLEPGGTFVVNVKDHIRDRAKQQVVAWHVDTLCRVLGLECVGHDLVPTKGLMAGENHDARTVAEVVLTFKKAAS